MTTTTEFATFAAGCFWSVEADFRSIPGVVDVAVGYTGGHVDHPTYREVCSHHTGHVEAALVEYDPAQVSYDRLVEVFYKIHNPTTLNRQGWDIGDQYRSEIFFHSPEQQKVALDSIEKYQPNFKKQIVTKVTPATTFCVLRSITSNT